ncbi:MAG: DUF1109 domain-containing protein [Candidatus Saccharibacteria bacterium]|nr:DUF1109 domain-containing protein [Pseudorhodobacter sp.]
MTTDDLIARLSTEPAPAPFRPTRIGLTMAFSVFVPVAVFLLALGTRHNLILAWSNPIVPFKTILPLVIFALSFLMLLRLIRPEARVGSTLWGYAAPALAALGLWVGAFALRAPSARFADVSAFSLAECLGSILILSVIPVIVMLRLVRQGASTSPLLSAGLVGLTAASGVTAGYSLFCTRDNPLFFVTWYGVAIVAVTLISAVWGRRVLRW